MKRRSFLLGLTGALAAPAIVRAESLMKLWVPPAPKLITALDVATGESITVGSVVTFAYDENRWKVVDSWTETPMGVFIGGDKVLLHDGQAVTLPAWPPPGQIITIARAT